MWPRVFTLYSNRFFDSSWPYFQKHKKELSLKLWGSFTSPNLIELMPSYRVRPGAIPKHLKITQQLPPASSGINSQYFVKGKPPIRASTVSPDTQLTNLSFSSAADAPQSAWFRLPRMRAEERSWFSRTTNARNAATAHPYSKLRDPLSIRIFDLIAMGSVPGMSF